MDDFDQKLRRLEQLSKSIKRRDLSVEVALAQFEEGTALANSLRKDLDEIEGKVQRIINNPRGEPPSKGGAAGELRTEGAADARGGSVAASGTGAQGARQEEQGAPRLALFDEGTPSPKNIRGTRS